MTEPNVFGQLYDILAELKAGGPIAGTPASAAAARRARRMAKVQHLIDQGATPGEREAAEEAMHRMQMDALDGEADDYIPL